MTEKEQLDKSTLLCFSKSVSPYPFKPVTDRSHAFFWGPTGNGKSVPGNSILAKQHPGKMSEDE